jgi:inner membrane protein
MYRLGHYGAALLAYAPVVFVLVVAGYPSLALVGILGSVGLATVPDYDLRVPVLSHRGITHTVWFVGVVAAVLAALGGVIGQSVGPRATVGLAAFGGVVGVVGIGSHVLADALTPMGVEPFAPLSDRHYTLALATADSSLANGALLVAGVFLATVAFVGGRNVAALVPI